MDRTTSIKRYYEPRPDYDMDNMSGGRQYQAPKPPPMPSGPYGSGPASPVYPSLPSAPQNTGNRPVMTQFNRSASVRNGIQDYQPPAQHYGRNYPTVGQNYGQNYPPVGQNYGQNYPPVGQNYDQSNYPSQIQNYNQQNNNNYLPQQYPKLQEYTPRNYPPPPAPIVAPPRPNNPQQQFSPRNGPAPIVIQPGASAFNPAPLKSNPTAYGGVPGKTLSGLEYLASLDGLTIRQRKEMVEIFTGCETANRYRILDSYNREIFYAKEHSSCCARYYCGRLRPFDMSLTDELQQEVIQFVRPFACDTCYWPCWLQTMQVQTPPGHTVATVEQKWSIWFPQYKVKDPYGETIYYIEGRRLTCCTCSWFCCCNDVDFVIYDNSKRVKLGLITKKWSGCLKEWCTDADNFTIKFPDGANVHMKATLLGVAMLIDYMFFER